MNSDIELSVILPAYNEAASIGNTVGQIRAYFAAQGIVAEVIVAADGNDGTREAARASAPNDPRLIVFGNLERSGKGRGIREGVARASGRIIGFVDADNKTPIEELAKILPHFGAGYDIVIGSRALGESKILKKQPAFRRVGSWAFGVTMRTLTGLKNIRDTQCGFKFFRHDVAKTLFAHQRVNGYMYDVEVLFLASRADYRIKEVGVRWRDDGDSRLNLVSGNIRNALDLLKIRLQTKPIPRELLRGLAHRTSHENSGLKGPNLLRKEGFEHDKSNQLAGASGPVSRT